MTRRNFLGFLGALAVAAALKVKGEPEAKQELVDETPVRDREFNKDHTIYSYFTAPKVGFHTIGDFVYLGADGRVADVDISGGLVGIVMNNARPGEDVWVKVG